MTTLTFGDTFTLPATRDRVWTIRDIRAPFAHLETQVEFTAAAKCETGENAVYVPGHGWSVSPLDGNREQLTAQLNELDVQLEERTDDEWVTRYQKLIARETRAEMTGILNLIYQWTGGTTIDRVTLRAHAAAVAALAVAESDDLALYNAVFHATRQNLAGDYATAEPAGQRAPFTEQMVEDAARQLYSYTPVWSYARDENIPWDDPDPAWIQKGMWRERAREVLTAALTDGAGR